MKELGIELRLAGWTVYEYESVDISVHMFITVLHWLAYILEMGHICE